MAEEEEEVVEEVVEDEPAAPAPAPPAPRPTGDDDDLNPHDWEKPGWTKKAPLKNTEVGQAAKSGVNLAHEITHVNKEKDESRDVNYDANPLYLKSTEKGKNSNVRFCSGWPSHVFLC